MMEMQEININAQGTTYITYGFNNDRLKKLCCKIKKREK